MPRRRTPTTNDMMTVFHRLLATYGSRNWWPAETAFEMIAGAILTQNTSWRNVESALGRMRACGLWSFDAVHQASDEALADAVRPSGYYVTKARKLKEFARVLMTEFDGELERMLELETVPLRERLLGIWGIGPETADCIVLYAAQKPSFVIDKYTMRIVDRLGWRSPGPGYADHQAMFQRLLPTDVAVYNEYHALLDRHASLTCRARPVCAGCCLADLCATGRTEATA